MVIKALIIGILYWLASNENAWPITTGNGISDPLVGGTLCGLILGDMKTGIEIGSAVEVMYISNVVIGGVATADVASVSYLCIPLALLSGADSDMAVSLAATIGVLGAAMITAYESIASIFYALGDKAVAKGDIKAMKRAYILYPQFIIFPVKVGLGYLTITLGAKYAQGILASIPELVQHMMSVLGGMLPSVGLSIMLSYTLKDKKMAIYFFLGLMATTYCGFNTVAVAVLGVCLAVMYYMFTSNKTTATVAANDEEGDDL